ncbi:RnfABCDGE type electron transport complex subunit D [Myxococcota bacterium]|nr:RnfABCDGE type electron transport complex subunit D [Myxococcota bacterium]
MIFVTTTTMKKRNPADGLKNSAFLATLLAVIGHAFLGFEQSLAQWLVAVLTAYATTVVFEVIDAKCGGVEPRFLGKTAGQTVLAFLSPHMTATTMAFLLYTNDRLDAMAFAVAAAIASKYVFRLWDGHRYRHFMNPSNFGIALTFFALPWVNTIPYQFAETTHGWADWAVSAVLLALGTRLNILFTGRMVVIGAWLAGFVAQALIRTALFGANLPAELMMMTGPAFVLFTFYMITDPMTSPMRRRSQVIFGLAIAAVYGLLMAFHVVFAIFFSVTIVCGLRGVVLAVEAALARRDVDLPAIVSSAGLPGSAEVRPQ